MKDFKWPDITQAVDQFVPLLSTAIIAAVTTTKTNGVCEGNYIHKLIKKNIIVD